MLGPERFRRCLKERSEFSILVSILFFLVVTFAALYFVFCFADFETALTVLRNANYAVLLFCLIGFGYFFSVIVRRHKAVLRQTYARPSAWITIGLTTWILLSSHPLGYRTVNDEIILSGTARQLSHDREPLFPYQGFYDRGELHVTSAFLDKRPLLFPVLLSIVHDITGYRAENAFYLNIFLCFLIITAAWGLGFYFAGSSGGIFGTLMLGTLPLLPMMATGGGFEIANLLWTILFFGAVALCFRQPDKISISLLIYTTILLSYLRYESAAFVLFAGITILMVWMREREMIIPFSIIIAPLLLIPLPLQQQVFEINEKYWQLEDVPGADSVFAFRYLPTNLGHALQYFLSAEDYVPTSNLLFLIGFPGVVFGFLLLRTWLTRGTPVESAMGIMWMALAAQASLILTYFWGQLDNPIIHRLSFPIWLWFWFGSMLLFKTWLRRPRLRFIPIGVAATFSILITMPLLTKHAYLERHGPPAIFNRLTEWTKEHLDHRNLVISDTPVFWINHNIPSYKIGSEDKDILFLDKIQKRRLYDEIYVFEQMRFDRTAGRLEGNSDLPDLDFIELEEIWTFAVDNQYGGRISRVVQVHTERTDAENAPAPMNFTNPNAPSKLDEQATPTIIDKTTLTHDPISSFNLPQITKQKS